MALNFLFFIHFSFFPYITCLKNLIGIFSGILKARMLNLVYTWTMSLLYCGIENQTSCCSFLYLFTFLSVHAVSTVIFVVDFSATVQDRWLIFWM